MSRLSCEIPSATQLLVRRSYCWRVVGGHGNTVQPSETSISPGQACPAGKPHGTPPKRSAKPDLSGTSTGSWHCHAKTRHPMGSSSDSVLSAGHRPYILSGHAQIFAVVGEMTVARVKSVKLHDRFPATNQRLGAGTHPQPSVTDGLLERT